MKKIFFVLIAVIIAGGFFWWVNGSSAVDPKNTSEKFFVIDKGESARQIGTDLKNAGLIKDATIFYLQIKLSGKDKNIQSGDFRLSPSQTLPSIINSLVRGPIDVWVTIVEGKRAAEINETLQSKIPSYDSSWKQQLIDNEGYLFPDTYLIPKDASIAFIIKVMRDNFDKKYQEALSSSTLTMSQTKVVILASLVQREGRSDTDMKYIASVLENRLNIGMALQVDASVQYIIGNSLNYWPQPKASDLKINSPYNTYLNPGLPPTPISNPGLSALEAVLAPAKTDYLYYFTDRKGITHFARTLDEQNANIAKFGI